MNANILNGFERMTDNRVRDLINHGFTDLTPEEKVLLFEKYINHYKEVIRHRDMEVQNDPKLIEKSENVLKMRRNK